MIENKNRTVYLGLPAFNEEAAIAPLFAKIQRTRDALVQSDIARDLQIIFYDDGSTDQTVAALKGNRGSLNVTLLSPEQNGGLGRALQGIITNFLDQASPGDVLVIMDTDDTHDPAQIVDLLGRMDSNDEQVVVASRYQRGARTSGVPPVRQFLSLGFALLIKVALPIHGVRDYSCGYRAYTYAALATARGQDGFQISEPGFASMPEILIRLRKYDIHFGEVPLHLAYDQRLTQSKMRAWHNSLRLLRCIAVWRVSPPQPKTSPEKNSSLLSEIRIERLDSHR